MVGHSRLRGWRWAAASGMPAGAGPAARLWAAITVVLIAAGLLVLAGMLLIVAVPVALLLVLAAAASRWVRRLRAPHGPFDGRRNVRVIVPGARSPGGPDG